MKLLIFGASDSGTTTLARSLAQKLDCKHLDADYYYWVKTPIPFQKKRFKSLRQAELQHDFSTHQNVIVSGSLVTWSDYWQTAFDLVVFLYLPPDIRLKRLQQREAERYGDALLVDKRIQVTSKAFLAWAAQYDDPNFDGRSITQHRNWMKLLDYPVVELTGDLTNNEYMEKVLAALTI
ncbi:MAG: AAA family ATPase [Bacteroidota bacterium]